MSLSLQDASLLRSQCLIGDRWVGGAAGIEVRNPATGALVGTVPKLGADATRDAVETAHAAWPAWRALTAKERAGLMKAWFALIMANLEDLARIMTAEQGKPLLESRSEIAYAASFVEWFAEEGKRVAGEIVPATLPGQRLVVTREPIGVCAAITPWNFPAAMITRKAGAALAAGCTMVVKPASQTPLTALALALLAERAGIPAGVLNVVTGAAGEVGTELATHPRVRKLTFTGSTEVGRVLMQQSAATIKKVSMELGGNAPFLVFDDADLDAAVDGALISKYRNAGQTCVCANRIYVQDSVYEAFAAKFVAAVAKLQVGNGMDDGVRVGPLIDGRAVAKVEEHVGDALARGGRLLLGGRRHALGGHFYEPTVIADAHPDMLVAREETFGPLAPLFRFSTEAEAIRLANDTEFGLASYFYARDVGRVWRVSGALEYGIVGVNTGLISNEVAPFGGVKQSGIGREGSRLGIDDYLVVKYTCMAGL